MERIVPQKLTIFDRQETTILNLLRKQGYTVNQVIDELQIALSELKGKVSFDDMSEIYHMDLEGDFTGSWHGISHPVMSEPGIQGQVIKLMQDVENIYLEMDERAFIVDPSMSFVDIQNVFFKVKDNKGGFVIFKEGIYEFTDTLSIFKNTTVICEQGVIIQKNHSRNVMILNGLWNETYNYNDNGNISWHGGVIDGRGTQTQLQSQGFSFGLAENIVLSNVHVTNIANNHHLEFSGCQNVYVTKCIFDNYHDYTVDQSRSYCEAIQISTNSEVGFPIFYGERKQSKRLFFDQCIFGAKEGNSGAVPVGIGEHGGVEEMTEHVVIANCEFFNCSYAGVRLKGWVHVTINSNQFFGCSKAILFSGNPTSEFVKVPNAPYHVIVDGNLIEKSADGIYAVGNTESGKLVEITGFIVSNNVFRNITGNCMRIGLCREFVIQGNTARDFKNFIYGGGCWNGIIQSNALHGGTGDGINLAGEHDRTNRLMNVSNNLISYHSMNGIKISKGQFCLIANNIFMDVCRGGANTYYGILYNAGSVDCQAKDNVMFGTRLAKFGFYATDDCSGIRTFNNDLNNTPYGNNASGSSYDCFMIYSNTGERKIVKYDNVTGT